MSIPFTCEHCGKSMSVDDCFAGQSGPCSNCGQNIMIPPPSGSPGVAQNGAIGVLGWILTVGVAGMMLFVGVGGLLYAMLEVRGQHSPRSESVNNMKNILLALHNYHDVNKALPPAYVSDANGKRLYSWRVLILPYMEQQDLYDQYDLSKAWDDPANLAVSQTELTIFRSPSDPTVAKNGTNYFCLLGSNTLLLADQGQSLAKVTDGMAETIALVEEKGIAGSWAAPIDPPLKGWAHVSVRSNGSTVVGMADGSVRTVDAASTAAMLQPSSFIVNDGIPAPPPN